MKNLPRGDITFLKFFVYLLGFVLIFATIFLTYAVYNKSLDMPNRQCSTLNLDVRDKIYEISTESGTVKIITRDENDNYKLLIYDYCNGNLINEVIIQGKRKSTDTETTIF